jgi:hypothetical protein
VLQWVTIQTVDPKQKKICEDSGLDSLLNLVSMPQVKVQSLATEVINSLAEGGMVHHLFDTFSSNRTVTALRARNRVGQEHN